MLYRDYKRVRGLGCRQFLPSGSLKWGTLKQPCTLGAARGSPILLNNKILRGDIKDYFGIIYG